MPGTHRIVLANARERIRDDIRSVLTHLEAQGTVDSPTNLKLGSPLRVVTGALLHAGDRDVVFEAELRDGRRIRGQAPEQLFERMRFSLYGK